VLAVGVSSSKPSNPRKKTKHALKKKTQTNKPFLAVLSTKNKFECVFSFFFFERLSRGLGRTVLPGQANNIVLQS
jgi:hypothetical protein